LAIAEPNCDSQLATFIRSLTHEGNAVTIGLFDEPSEAIELSQAQVSMAERLLFRVWAAVVSAIPALAAAYSALEMSRFFRSLRNAEDATNSSVFAHMHILNMPMVIALGIAAFLALGFALVLAIEPKRRLASVGLPFSISVPILAAMPALFLWFAETNAIDVFSSKLLDATVASTAQTVSLLLFAAMVWGLLVLGAAVVFSIVSLCIPMKSRTDAFSLRRACVWAVTGTLLLVFAGAYFVLV
jgi:hypothetical protein